MTNFRGIDEKSEHSARQMTRDTRPLGTRLADWLCEPTTCFTIISILGIAGFITPIGIEIYFLLLVGLNIFYLTRHTSLPFKIPKVARIPDYNDCIPGTNTPKLSAGITFFGNEQITDKELWFSNDDMRTHVLIFGSTGSGKTEALVSLAFNSLCQGSGFIYIDGKGDNSLYAKIFSMVRYMGRDDDLLLVNFMTGARDIIGAQKTRLSNTMNPFNQGSSSMLSELVVSLMDSGSGGGDGDMWKGRAISFVQALMRILTVMRDEGHLLLDAHTVRNYFLLEKLEQIVVDRMFPLDNGSPIPLNDLPDVVLQPLKMYLDNLPGYVPSRKGNQAGEVREQHGFITMQLTRVFSSLADTYGHIIRANLAEIDFKDVVLNRRILCVLLPALEKSPDELSNLGKIIVASIKAMMASGLGEDVEGTYQDIIQRKPTNSPTPFVCIMDEYGYYAVKGFAVVPAQARSLGFSAIFAGQDLPAFQKVSKEEAASIGANTNIKICMKLEDPAETWDFFNKVASEAYVTNVREFASNSDSLTQTYADTRSASVDKRARIDILDLKDQLMGDAHIFFRSRIVRARMFYANPKPAKKMQVNQFLCIEKPSEDILVSLDSVFRSFYNVLYHNNYTVPKIEQQEFIEKIVNSFNDPQFESLQDKAIHSILSILDGEIKEAEEEIAIEESSAVFDGSVHLFSAHSIPKIADVILKKGERETLEKPLVSRAKTANAMIRVERSLGISKNKAQPIIDDFLDNMKTSSTYPETHLKRIEVKVAKKLLNDVINKLSKGIVEGQS
ncbi:phosphoesterase [bacterium]|nr:phosphoesterase [bacterium]NBW56986.1 phosphoesterase [bacterium]NBX71943.1 phosphoesterase [bacterium]